MLKIKTDVTTEPIDTTFVGTYINKLETLSVTQAALMNNMIKAARELCEQYTGRTFAQKTYTYWISEEEVNLNDRIITLPMLPHSSITSVTPYDAEGTALTDLVAGTGYYLQGQAGGEYELLIPQESPSTGVTISITNYLIEYIAGYSAADCEVIPAIFKEIMANVVSYWWGNDKNYIPVLPQEFKMALGAYRKVVF